MYRYDRVQRRHALQEMLNETPSVVEKEIKAFLAEEVESIIKKQIDKARQYFKPSRASTEVETLCKQLSDALQTIQQLKDEIALKGLPPFCKKDFKSDEFTRLFTGLKVTFEHVYKTMPTERTTKLTAFQEFVCTLIQLSINPLIQDLGYQFGVSTSTVSRILFKWLRQMDIHLRDLIYWPDREALQKTMPVCFQQSCCHSN